MRLVPQRRPFGLFRRWRLEIELLKLVIGFCIFLSFKPSPFSSLLSCDFSVLFEVKFAYKDHFVL